LIEVFSNLFNAQTEGHLEQFRVALVHLKLAFVL